MEKLRAELPIAPFWFDLLYLEGGGLLEERQWRRFEELKKLAPSSVVPHFSTSEASAGHRFLEEALAQAFQEGLRVTGRPIEPEEQYDDVGDYDPVLRSHCRLEPRG